MPIDFPTGICHYRDMEGETSLHSNQRENLMNSFTAALLGTKLFITVFYAGLDAVIAAEDKAQEIHNTANVELIRTAR